ncbi:hypothetical protein BV20DRAFT_38073 [Pilatotrama ljubarskyi]|nr:hypothetical protein BV20DRAFT_38073 [Pilatotrama ljubarskyi]
MSEAQLARWLATTDANLTFIGPRPDFTPLGRRSAQNNNTIVVYCSKRTKNDTCGGTCTVYNGGPQCVDIPLSQCMMATQDIGFCDKKACKGLCDDLFACGTILKDGFCFTFDTKSILVSDD